MKSLYSKDLKSLEVGQEVVYSGEVKTQSIRVSVSVYQKSANKRFTVSKKPDCVIVRRVA